MLQNNPQTSINIEYTSPKKDVQKLPSFSTLYPNATP